MPESVSYHFMDYLPIIFMGIITIMVGILVVLIFVFIIAYSYIQNDKKYKLMIEQKKKNILEGKDMLKRIEEIRRKSNE